MREMAAPKFLNLDIVLKSSADFGPLISDFGERVFVISHEEYQGQFILVLELAESKSDLKLCTSQFLEIIATLPSSTLDLWYACSSRTFSYGFESGTGLPALDTSISADLVSEITRIKADIGITIYPFYPDAEP